MVFFCVCIIYDVQTNKLFIMVINQILNRKIIVLRNSLCRIVFYYLIDLLLKIIALFRGSVYTGTTQYYTTVYTCTAQKVRIQ